jgi:protease I
MPSELQNHTVALLVAPRGTEEAEFTDPRQAVEDAGGRVDVIGSDAGEAETVNRDLDPGSSYAVDKTFAVAHAEDYDALIIPGGSVGSDTLRGTPEAVAFVQHFFEAGKPVAAICHAPWVLVEAGVVERRRLTSYPTLQTDIRNAGGEWTDEEVVTDHSGDGSLTTSRTPDDLPAFCERIVEEFAGQRAT